MREAQTGFDGVASDAAAACRVSLTFICQTIKEHCLKISERLVFSSEVILAVLSVNFEDEETQ